MTTMEALAKEAIVLKLLRLYRSLDGRANRALIDAYLEPVEPYSVDAVQQAFERILDDQVVGADPEWPVNVGVWHREVKMLDSVLKRITRGGDGLVTYRLGELPPPGTEALGPVKLGLAGRVVDVSHLSLAEKEVALKTGRLPEAEPAKNLGFQPKIRRM